jgi:alpha-aminoadipate carrier protein LysW
MTMGRCTECEAEIELESSTEVGEIIQCPDCGMDLEVISIEPSEFAPAPEEEEDWGE